MSFFRNNIMDEGDEFNFRAPNRGNQSSNFRQITPSVNPVQAPIFPQQPAQQAPVLPDFAGMIQSRFMAPDRDRSLSNLTVGNNAGEAMDMWRGLINSQGGNYDALLAEIGATRMMDRFREYVGRGDTLGQSGIINIGNGQTLQSLRPLTDFNQPMSVQNPVQGTAQQTPQPAAQIQGPNPSGGGGGNVGSGNVLGELATVLSQIFSQPRGLSDDAMQRQLNIINTNAAQREQQGLQNLENVFANYGQIGGGQLGARASEFSQGVTDTTADQVNSLLMTNEQLAQQQLNAAIQGALGMGSLSNQMTLGQGQLGLGHAQLGVQRELGLGDQALRRDLGFGDLDLRRFLGGGQLNLANNQFLADLALQEFLVNSGIFFPGGLG